MNHSGYSLPSMPAISPDHPDPLSANHLKKRKRDPIQDQIHLSHASNLSPSSLYHLASQSRLDLPIPKETTTTNNSSDHPVRHRCIPRKRRVLHQQIQYPYQSQWTDPDPSLAAKLLHPNIHPSPGPGICKARETSPPVSPKTLLPLQYPPSAPGPVTCPGTGSDSASPTALRPCHICHRKPTTRELLDAYADCDLCGNRACYICLRQCDASDCGGGGGSVELDAIDAEVTLQGCVSEERILARKVCSWCAVEGVSEGGVEVVQCVECVRGRFARWEG